MSKDWMLPPDLVTRLWSDAIVEAAASERTDVGVFADKVALAAVEAYKASLKPVAWLTETQVSSSVTSVSLSMLDYGTGVPLYRLDGGDDDAA